MTLGKVLQDLPSFYKEQHEPLYGFQRIKSCAKLFPASTKHLVKVLVKHIKVVPYCY